MLASDKQVFRAIQGEVGDVINALNAKQYTNAELAQFYDHNDTDWIIFMTVHCV